MYLLKHRCLLKENTYWKPPPCWTKVIHLRSFYRWPLTSEQLRALFATWWFEMLGANAAEGTYSRISAHCKRGICLYVRIYWLKEPDGERRKWWAELRRCCDWGITDEKSNKIQKKKKSTDVSCHKRKNLWTSRCNEKVGMLQVTEVEHCANLKSIRWLRGKLTECQGGRLFCFLSKLKFYRSVLSNFFLLCLVFLNLGINYISAISEFISLA